MRDKPPAQSEGVKLQLCQTRLGLNTALAGMKHISRLEYVLAGLELNAQNCEGLLLDTSGHLVETLHHNFFWVENNTIRTPQLYAVGVHGVMRRVLLEKIIPDLGLSIEEVLVPVSRLMHADEVFITNAVNGVRPVHQLDQLAWVTGPITQRIMQALVAEFPSVY